MFSPITPLLGYISLDTLVGEDYGGLFFGESPVRSEGFDGLLRVMQDTYNPAMLWKSILASLGDGSKMGSYGKGLPAPGSRAQGAPFP